MELITAPSDIPDEKYHTLNIEKTNDGDFEVTAKNNETVVRVFVGSIGIDGESVGIVDGEVEFDAAGSWIRLEYVDFTEEYGYGEVQVTFEKR
jgi:hypothetical protein